MSDLASRRSDITERILDIVGHHGSAAPGLVLSYFDDDNDPDGIAAEVLDGMIATGTLERSPGGVFVRISKLTATTITEDQIRELMDTADREIRKICEIALRSDEAKTRGAYLMKLRRKGAARARLAEILNGRNPS